MGAGGASELRVGSAIRKLVGPGGAESKHDKFLYQLVTREMST